MSHLHQTTRLPLDSGAGKRIRQMAAAACPRWVLILLAGICLLALAPAARAQTQVGSDIDGEAAGDHSGFSVSLSSDGTVLAVGAPQNDGNGADSGHVRVYYQWSNYDWAQLGDDIDGEAAFDASGYSVSLSEDGNRLAVGAITNSGGGEYSGHVRVYQWMGGVAWRWGQLGSDIDGEAAGDNSGFSVSLSSSGNRVAVSAAENDGPGENVGHVRVFELSGSDWVQMGADMEGEGSNDHLQAVSLSAKGDRVAFGAWGNDGNGADSGHARVYGWSGGAWTQLGADIDGEAAGDRFGSSVSLSSNGNRLAVGAPGNDGNGTYSGHVRVFEWNGGAWTQLGADIDGEGAEDFSGNSVSLSGDGNRLAIGAASNSDNGDYAGQVRIYQWSGGAWTRIGSDIDGEAANDAFGRAVSLASNGNRVAGGADQNDGNGSQSGHVRIYDLTAFNEFRINAGLNDAWYYKPTDGQGFFITVFPALGYVSLAWFTYDTVRPDGDVVAYLGDPGHRWLTALGPIDGNQSVMDITITSGGIFDTATELQKTDPPGSDGTLTVTFDSCNSGTVEYDIPSINREGVVPIERVVDDNVVICEALLAE